PELNVGRKWAVALFSEGIFNGFFVVLSFCIPIIILFTLINLIQQIGIMSRISILLDRAFNKFGLSGRSVVNLLTGFGCNVTSILMTRSSNSKKEHIISLIVAPFISCSSRTIVFSTICTMIFGISLGWMYVAFLLFMSGIIALFIGFTFSKTMFRRSKSFFLVEAVNWRKPDFFVIFKSVGLQLKSFVIKAATFILIANFIIWFFTHIGPTGILLDNEIDTSLFGYAARSGLNYLMYPFGGSSYMGYVGNSDGWKMTLSLITAFPAKEIALGNITTLFGSQANFQLFVSTNIPIVISYMTIFLLYLPCAATISVLRKEGGWKLLATHLGISLSISYILGVISYWIAFGIVMIH
ncbi:MAG: ferrous iron transporter B, partial [Mycoplasma sp.]|nr:ferrous iron transporter B [Mycoplasma sp.]